MPSHIPPPDHPRASPRGRGAPALAFESLPRTRNDESKKRQQANFLNHCGEGEIRTPDGVSPMPVFETGAFDHSATSPCAALTAALNDFQKIVRSGFSPPEEDLPMADK